MQDKIQEIIGLVDAYAHHERMQDAEASAQCREFVESKLRELVREPLSDEKILEMAYAHGGVYVANGEGDYGSNADTIVSYSHILLAAHGITKDGGE